LKWLATRAGDLFGGVLGEESLGVLPQAKKEVRWKLSERTEKKVAEEDQNWNEKEVERIVHVKEHYMP
jgi:hypothetical protein